MNPDRVYVIDMLERIAMIADFAGSEQSQFEADRKTQEAVIRCFEVMSEGASKLSDELRIKYAQVG